jgi:chromosome segregation ATPase
MSDLKFEHEQAMIRTADDNKDTEQQLVERYQKQIAEKDRTLQRLKDSIQGQVAEQTRRYKDKISALNSQIDDLEANARKVEDRARRQFEDQEKRLKQTHQQEMRAVKQEKENLVGALVERSAFKGIADHVVEARFKKLAKAVDQFARTCTNWDKNREMDWPCSENVLRTHENPRQMKQYFIQNNVWTLLYDNIFNTPFQCFGDDGQTYYEEWIGTFGESKSYILFNALNIS